MVKTTRRASIVSVLTNPDGERWTMRQERKPEASFGRQFMVVFPSALAEIASDPACTAPTYRVLIWAWKNLSYERWRQLHQMRVGEELQVSAGAVSRGLNYLLDKGLIERQGSGPRQEWRLTTEGGWMGTAGAYQKRRRETGVTGGIRLAVDNASDDDAPGAA